MAKVKEIRRPGGDTGLVGLVEQRAALEGLLVELSDADERLEMVGEGASLSLAHRRIRTRLLGAERRVTQLLLRVENRIACMPINTIEHAVLKLTIYGKLQGYEFGRSRPRRDVVSTDERLFFSVLDDLRRLMRSDSDEQREQSSDRKRSIKARR